MSKSAAEILANVDVFAEDQREHLLDALAIARRERPILPVQGEGGYHLVTRYDDVREVCEHPEVFSSVHPGLRIEIAFDELLARATHFRLEKGVDIPRLAGEPPGCPARLPLRFDRR